MGLVTIGWARVLGFRLLIRMCVGLAWLVIVMFVVLRGAATSARLGSGLIRRMPIAKGAHKLNVLNVIVVIIRVQSAEMGLC